MDRSYMRRQSDLNKIISGMKTHFGVKITQEQAEYILNAELEEKQLAQGIPEGYIPLPTSEEDLIDVLSIYAPDFVWG